MSGKGEKRTKYGSVVSYFEKAKDGDVFCPGFWEAKPFNGCHFDCDWCYLNGTFRYNERGKKPYMKDQETTLKHLKAALEENDTPSLYNVGEVADGLIYPVFLFEKVVPLFREAYEKKGHKLLVVTKNDSELTRFYAAKAHQFVIVSYSVNAVAVSAMYEKSAPDPLSRLEAAKYLAEIGYEVRLRIDPMVPVENYHIGYHILANEILRRVPTASVITLGSLRGLNSTIIAAKRLGKDTSWTKYLSEESSWGKRVKTRTRLEMYEFMIRALRKKYAGHIALCKETYHVWSELQKRGHLPHYSNATCNCIDRSHEE